MIADIANYTTYLVFLFRYIAYIRCFLSGSMRHSKFVVLWWVPRIRCSLWCQLTVAEHIVYLQFRRRYLCSSMLLTSLHFFQLLRTITYNREGHSVAVLNGCSNSYELSYHSGCELYQYLLLNPANRTIRPKDLFAQMSSYGFHSETSSTI